MNPLLVPVLMLVAEIALAVAWALLLTAGVRLRGRPIPGRRWLRVAGAVGTAGAAAGFGLFILTERAAEPEMRELTQALILFLPASQLAALLCAAWGLRRAWRAAEGWDAAGEPSAGHADRGPR